MHSELSYKRLESGKFTWPPVRDGGVTLSATQLRLLFTGVDWTQLGIRPSVPARRNIMPENIGIVG